MNKYLKAFINTCITLSLLFLGLILAEYLFSFSIILPPMLMSFVSIGIGITLISLFAFSLNMLNKDYRELYFNGHIGFNDLLGSGFFENFKNAVQVDNIKNLFIHGQISIEQLKQLNNNAIFLFEVEDYMSNLFAEGHITLEQLDHITFDMRIHLGIDYIRNLFIDCQITIEQLKQLNDYARIPLGIENIRALFIEKQITLEQLAQLNYCATDALKVDNIKNLFIQNQISIAQLNELSYLNNALKINNIRDLFVDKLITIEQLNQLDINALRAFKVNSIRELFGNKLITIEQLNQLDINALGALKDNSIRELFGNKLITIEQLNQLNIDARTALEIKNIRELFVNKLITIEQLNQLKHGATVAFEIDRIKDLYANDQISLDQVFQFNHTDQADVHRTYAVSALITKDIRNLFINNQITFDQLFQFDTYSFTALEEYGYIRNLLTSNQITFDQLIQLNRNSFYALRDDYIMTLFIGNQISFEQLNLCNYTVQNALNDPIVREMFTEGHLNFNQIRQCTHEVIFMLNDEMTRNQIINNEMTFGDLIRNLFEDIIQDANQRNPDNVVIANTHTASVHESVSDSAIALANKYGQSTNETDVTNQIIELKNNIDHFSLNTTITAHIHEAAKRGLESLAQLDTDFKDPKSELSINQLIALTHMAAQDDKYRQHTYKDYLEAMILALYEIQRGYNINNIDKIDDGSNDSPICLSGTFNKIIERMISILPDCHIHIITFQTISIKTNQLINNIISKFFDERSSLDLPNEDELSSLEITQRATYIDHLKDIINSESNHEDNPLFNALNTKLLQEIPTNLKKEFGANMDKYITEDFNHEIFLDMFLSSKPILNFIHTQLDHYIERHQIYKNLKDELSLFHQKQKKEPSPPSILLSRPAPSRNVIPSNQTTYNKH